MTKPKADMTVDVEGGRYRVGDFLWPHEIRKLTAEQCAFLVYLRIMEAKYPRAYRPTGKL